LNCITRCDPSLPLIPQVEAVLAHQQAKEAAAQGLPVGPSTRGARRGDDADGYHGCHHPKFMLLLTDDFL
jgi:hypothetical protein